MIFILVALKNSSVHLAIFMIDLMFLGLKSKMYNIEPPVKIHHSYEAEFQKAKVRNKWEPVKMNELKAVTIP